MGYLATNRFYSWELKAFLIILFSSISAFNQELPSDVKEPSFFSYGFDNTGHEIKNCFEQKDYQKMFEIYNANSETLVKKKNKYDYWYYVSSKQYNEDFEMQMQPLIDDLQLIVSSNEFLYNQWDKTTTELTQADNRANAYNTYILLKDPRFRSSKIDEYSKSLNNMKGFVNLKRLASFEYYLSQPFHKPFHEVYPLVDEPKKFYADINIQLGIYSNTINSEQMIKFLTIHNDWIVKNNVYAITNNILSRSEKDNHEYGFVNFLNLCWDNNLKQDIIYDFINNNLRVLKIKNGPDDHIGDFDISIPGITTELITLEDLKTSVNAKQQQKHILVIQQNEAVVDRKVIEKSDISSRFISGYQLQQNQDHFNAQLEYDRARNRYYSLKSQADNYRPAGPYDFGGIVLAVQAGNASQAMNAALNVLESTPMEIKVPQYQEYQYGITSIESNKKINYTIYYGNNIGFLKFQKNDSCIFQHKIAYNVNEHDPSANSILSKYSKELDVDAKEKEEWQIPIKSLISEINNKSCKTLNCDSAFSEIKLNNLSTIKSTPNISIAKATSNNDERMRSVVIVNNPKGGFGSGFYVTKNQIITNYHVVEGSSFAEIKNLAGETFVGKVIKTDPGLDLALLKVTMNGFPVTFTEELPNTGISVDAIGHPKGLFFSLTRGIISAIRYIPNPLVPGSNKMLVIQTDAAINPGNSGGPLYINDKVIGLNSQKLSAKGIEGLGFALHSSEIIKFIN